MSLYGVAVQILDKLGFPVNPAIEEKQDAIIENQTDGTQKTQLQDVAGRNVLNTVFGEQINGRRIPSIAAQFQYGFPADTGVPEIANGGTISILESMLTLSTSTAMDGAAALQTKEALRYLPGHEAYVFFTGVFTQGVADSYQRMGLFDDQNGFFLGYEDDLFYVTRRRDAVDTKHLVTLEDVFPGFDPTNGNVYKISFGYLGFATINFEVMKPDGGWATIHKIEYPNSQKVTHILNSNLPARVSAANTGNGTDIIIKIGSFTAGVVDGGGGDATVRNFTYGASAQPITAVALMAITFRSKEEFKTLKNYITSVLSLLSFNTDLSKSSSWELRKNMTLTNVPTWTDVDTLDSIMEYSTDATVTPGTGNLDFSVPLGKVDRVLITDLTDQKIQLLPTDIMTLLIKSPLGTTGTYDLSFRWKELF